MGKTMPKANVIWGEQHSVSLASFNSGHMANIIDLIHRNIGPKEAIDHSAAQAAVQKAKGNKKMKDGYVKVGLIGTDLVLRCKEKKFLGDIEVDAILVRNYPSKKRAWEQQKMLDDLQKIEDQKEAERQKKEREEQERKESERQERLRKVMNTPDQEGVTMRDKILRAAKNAQKLGVGDYAKGKLKEQGLTPMDERYHGEAIDPKNRYGRYMPELRKVWEEHASTSISYGKWLDEAEAGHTGVPGVTEALKLRKPSNEGGGPIIEGPDQQRGTRGGVAGGQVVYLDDEARKPYAARVSKGVISGGKIEPPGDTIFVIGPDNKIYVGTKKRGTTGQRSAFNHSSFFSGGPVKAAGTLKETGGRITLINDLSGHYTPTREMVIQAVRKFGGGDQGWLADVKVKIGSAAPISGAQLLGEEHEKQSTEIWGKYSVGALSREDAARALMAGSDGNWLVRVGSNQKLVISYRKGDEVDQDLVTSIGSKGLDRKKLLLPEQVRTLLKSAPPTTPKRSPSRTGQQTQSTTTAPRRTGEKEQKEQEQEEKDPVTQEMSSAMRSSPGWHDNLNRVGAEALLKGKPGAWLLREGRDKFVALSFNLNGNLRHTLVDSGQAYENMVKYTQPRIGQAIRP